MAVMVYGWEIMQLGLENNSRYYLLVYTSITYTNKCWSER